MNDKIILHNVSEIGSLLNLNKEQSYELVNKKDFPAIYVGRDVIISLTNLYGYVNSMKKE